MSRGFMWENLSEEIADEFAGLSHHLLLSDAVDMFRVDPVISHFSRVRFWAFKEGEEDKKLGKVWHAKLRAQRKLIVTQRRHAEAKNLTPAERMRVTRARRAAEGRCTLCENYRAPGFSRCSMHLAERRETTANKCGAAGCPKAPVAGRARCDEHLKKQRETTQRYRERKQSALHEP